MAYFQVNIWPISGGTIPFLYPRWGAMQHVGGESVGNGNVIFRNFYTDGSYTDFHPYMCDGTGIWHIADIIFYEFENNKMIDRVVLIHNGYLYFRHIPILTPLKVSI